MNPENDIKHIQQLLAGGHMLLALESKLESYGLTLEEAETKTSNIIRGFMQTVIPVVLNKPYLDPQHSTQLYGKILAAALKYFQTREDYEMFYGDYLTHMVYPASKSKYLGEVDKFLTIQRWHTYDKTIKPANKNFAEILVIATCRLDTDMLLPWHIQFNFEFERKLPEANQAYMLSANFYFHFPHLSANPEYVPPIDKESTEMQLFREGEDSILFRQYYPEGEDLIVTNKMFKKVISMNYAGQPCEVWLTCDTVPVN